MAPWPSNGGLSPQTLVTSEPSQVLGLLGFDVQPLFTIGETTDDSNGPEAGYTPPGIPDGIGAYAFDEDTVRFLVNHELSSRVGYEYTLDNGSALTGARVSYFDVNTGSLELEGAGLAYGSIVNRAGLEVDLTDTRSDNDLDSSSPVGINRLCSAQYFEAHQFGKGRGLEDGLFFTGEETEGGTEFVLDPATDTLYAVPWMGRAGWESVTELDTGRKDTVALLIGDDRAGAPLLMYVGQKGEGEGPDVLVRNGLAQGKLYAWVADDGSIDPSMFNGTGSSLSGTWMEIEHYRPDLAGTEGYDDLGFATQVKQDELAAAVGAFQFSRPEDVSTNPLNGTEAVLASTGRGELFGGADNWGTTYIIDTDFSKSLKRASTGRGSERSRGKRQDLITGELRIVYDGDDAGNGQFSGPDFGLRSPDNLDWADNGKIYIQEDRSTSPSSLFGGTSGEEASIWELDPLTGALIRVGQVDRSAIPSGQVDTRPVDLGNWETSGILDVSRLFDQPDGSLFIFDVQAHSLRGGTIDSENLVEGGQLSFLIGTESTLLA